MSLKENKRRVRIIYNLKKWLKYVIMKIVPRKILQSRKVRDFGVHFYSSAICGWLFYICD